MRMGMVENAMIRKWERELRVEEKNERERR